MVEHLLAGLLDDGGGVEGLAVGGLPTAVLVAAGQAHHGGQAQQGAGLVLHGQGVEHGAAERLVARGSAGRVHAAHADDHR